MSKAIALLLAAATLIQARGITPEDYLRFEFVGAPAISPNGKSVAFPLTKINEKLNRRMTAIWLVPYDGSAAPRVSRIVVIDVCEVDAWRRNVSRHRALRTHQTTPPTLVAIAARMTGSLRFRGTEIVC